MEHCAVINLTAVPICWFYQVMEAEGLMVYLVAGLSDPVLKVQLAAVRCLHSLSRSVHQLRTNIHDQSISKPLLKVMSSFLLSLYV